MPRLIRLLLTMALLTLQSHAVRAASENDAALKDLKGFLFDPGARAAFAKGNNAATSANNFLEAFPNWAQTELLEIVMLIASESMTGATKHADAYQQGGVAGAKASFSPAVRARVDAFVGKILKDPSFNNPTNLKKMNQLLPVLRSNGS